MSAVIMNFEYGGPRGQGTSAAAAFGTSGLAVTILSDRAYWRAEAAEDMAAAGLHLAHAGALPHSSDAGAAGPASEMPAIHPVLGDIVLVDCPQDDDARRMDLAGLGQRAFRIGAQLVVSTTHDALDMVYGCLDHGAAQILVTPSRAERMIALGTVMPMAGNRLRELSETDRLALLRLTEQVTQLAQKLNQIAPERASAGGEDTPFRFGRDGHGLRDDSETDRLVRSARPPLPDPRLVRRIVRHRQLRARFFESELFADPAWDILLDLTAARAEHTRVSVSSLCIASGVPTSTALRWIGQLIDAGLLQRLEDDADRRRAFIALTDKAADAMARYFAELGPTSSAMV